MTLTFLQVLKCIDEDNKTYKLTCTKYNYLFLSISSNILILSTLKLSHLKLKSHIIFITILKIKKKWFTWNL